MSIRSFVCVAVVAAMTGQAQAGLLLLDTFDNSQYANSYAGNDYGLNKELTTRQSGAYAGTIYNVGGNYTGDASQTQVNTNGFGSTLLAQAYTGAAGWLSLNQDFGKNATVSLTVRPITQDEASSNTSTYWAAVGILGADSSPNNITLPVASDVGASLLIRSNGEWQYFENGSFVTSGSASAANTYDMALSVNAGVLTAKIGENTVLTHTLTGAAATRTVNYVSLGSNGIVGECICTFDNLTVATVTPEPTSLVMLLFGCACLAIYARQKRKS